MKSASLTEAEFAELLGRHPASAEFQVALNKIAEPPAIEQFEGGRETYAFRVSGLQFAFDDNALTAIFFFGPNTDPNSKPYSGELPFHLNFSDSKESTIAKLGPPHMSHDGRDDPRAFVRVHPWVKYRQEKLSLHVEFSMDASTVRLVTLLLPI
jgi:hypothetical protein